MTVATMKPREAIQTWALGPKHFKALAALRVQHAGGVPTLEPDAWSGAFEGERLVAAIGFTQEKPDMMMVVEVDRTPDHWGKIGTLVLIKEFIAAAEARGIRVQAMVLPANSKLKEALSREGAKCVVEIWEKPKADTPSTLSDIWFGAKS
jgi:hypothetical protein